VGTRWRTLGVPGGHVDVVLDGLLPRIRACYPVSAEGTGTIVAGQSLGGVSALGAPAPGGPCKPGGGAVQAKRLYPA